MRLKKTVLYLALGVWGLAGIAPANADIARQDKPAGLLGSYVVMLKPDVTDVTAQAQRLTKAAGGKLGHVYQSSIKGFSVQMSAEAAQRMRSDPSVRAVEADAVVRTQSSM
jgi:subtilisin